MSQQPAVGVIPEFTVGDRLRKAREHIGMDQIPFADELGVSRGTVSNYESGATTHLKPIVVRAWALRTGVPAEWLLTGTTNPRPGDPDGGEMITAQRAREDSNLQPSDP